MKSFKTERLSLELLTREDAAFILELVNTKGWIEFIGNRNLHSVSDATAYVERIIDNPNIIYWTIRLKDNKTPVGIITRIQRDYLDDPDIGFALLPGYAGKGYAYEAAQAVLKHLFELPEVQAVLAIVLPKNQTSIQLLKKLGLHYNTEIKVDKDLLHVYKVSRGRLDKAV